MITNLIYITLIVALVFESGFWDSMDEFINKQFPLHHLPHIFKCQFCQCWWLCLLYVIITGNLSLLNIVICLVMANISELERPIIKIIKCSINKLTEYIINLLY